MSCVCAFFQRPCISSSISPLSTSWLRLKPSTGCLQWLQKMREKVCGSSCACLYVVTSCLEDFVLGSSCDSSVYVCVKRACGRGKGEHSK